MNSIECENKNYFECFAFGDSPEMADENFEQWKSGNIRYWTRDAARRGYTFNDQTPITFEHFEVVEVF